jgi:hypothetical protein
MLDVPEHLRNHLSPWFDVKTHGNPQRPGIYRGSANGIDGDYSIFQLGYYYWDMADWSEFGPSPDDALRNHGRRPLISPRNWQGLRTGSQ